MRSYLAYDLLVSLAIIAGLTAAYALAAQAGTPRPGGLLGHGLGIAGLLLMLANETLYSLRKRVRGVHRGRMSVWLQAHIVTGIVGPWLVLLHSGGKFNGLAGLLTVLSVLIALSGFVGRFIYTLAPRACEATGLAGADATAQTESLLRTRRLLSCWYWLHIPLGITVFVLAFVHVGAALYYSTLLM